MVIVQVTRITIEVGVQVATCVVLLVLIVVGPLISYSVVSILLLVTLSGRVGLLAGIATVLLSGSVLIVAIIVILLGICRL